MDNKVLQTMVLFVFCGAAFGVESEVSWLPGDTDLGVNVSRTPANPTTADTISFIIPTNVYRNQWEAEQRLGGTPTLIIDPVQRRIDLRVVPSEPPDPIPTDFDPVNGLEGHFGPLEEGSWLFFVQFQGVLFVDPFFVRAGDETPPARDLFAEHFTSGADAFDLMNTSILFTPSEDGASYTVQAQRIAQLPTDPVDGINLGLGDDDSAFFDLAGSARVFLYGNSFSRVHVGSNGYITFGQGDLDFSESLPDHFERRRISGLFRDLNPSARGRVSWKQLSDRAVVTWEDIPEFGTNNTNTFQIALFFDGRIQLSWRIIDAVRGIVGLSDGLGVPPDFQEIDFSELSAEPPPPPPPVADQLVEQFTSGADAFDLSFTSITFSPTEAGTSYSAKVQEISQLPTDPAGGTALELGDDEFAFVKLASGGTVSLYGNSFASFYVGSNGYITFTEGDRDFSESLVDHFGTLRVSGLFRDLDPSSGARIRWKQLADRAVVTWLDVPEFGTSNSNTFQIEMFFDGRIRVSWLGVEAQRGIVGLSDGLGVPPDFRETDFSSLLAEPPPPPVVDYLTEEFASVVDTFDLAFSSVTFTPTEDGTSYTGSLQNITQLPTSPSGGTNLGLRDDNFVRIGLSNQARVRIFGQSFSSFFVGSNGYITFTGGDQDFSPTLAEHFDTLRISGLYADLNASLTGSVTGRQLSNRVAITWQNVPEFDNPARNTFQIEMFYDGRIRLSWLEIGSRNNIVGLSNGLGLPPDFVETDFSFEYSQPSILQP